MNTPPLPTNSNLNRSNLVLKRIAAYIIDVVILFIPQFVLGVILGIILSPQGVRDFSLIGRLADIVTWWVYTSSMESSKFRGSLGKLAMGLRVSDMSGNRISFAQASGRFFGKFISGIILLLGYLMVLWDKNVQTLHDKMSSCIVREKESEQNAEQVVAPDA